MAVKKVGQYLAEVRNLGVWGSLKQIRQMNLIKPGTLVGVDRAGNKYYENKEYLYGRDRWVDYAASDFDASQVPPEWHAWLHHSVDVTPKDADFKDLVPRYQRDHLQNQTGTKNAYHPRLSFEDRAKVLRRE
eukprot:TRINITY_DN13699_c0_g1_i1.p2 TRINITY_DN13699_c0_g1~~TRINITY_DN13699_c0_g1_i1.p2  ORF type:complete len:132 (+),score=18.76 TRINITY_DN13699_c0_g1_i1:19-414(+)